MGFSSVAGRGRWGQEILWKFACNRLNPLFEGLNVNLMSVAHIDVDYVSTLHARRGLATPQSLVPLKVFS